MNRILLALLLLSTSTQAMSNLDSLMNKTWFIEDSFAGHQYVFFKTENGKMKSIKQVFGSGVCVIKSEIYDIQLKADTVYFINGLDLNTKERANTPRLPVEDKNRSKEMKKQFNAVYREPLIFNWATQEICDGVDFRGLLKISLEENEVYDLDQIRSLRVERKK